MVLYACLRGASHYYVGGMMDPIWLLIGLLVFTTIWTVGQILSEHRRIKKTQGKFEYCRDLFGHSTSLLRNIDDLLLYRTSDVIDAEYELIQDEEPKSEYPIIRVVTDDWEYEERLGRPGRSG